MGKWLSRDFSGLKLRKTASGLEGEAGEGKLGPVDNHEKKQDGDLDEGESEKFPGFSAVFALVVPSLGLPEKPQGGGNRTKGVEVPGHIDEGREKTDGDEGDGVDDDLAGGGFSIAIDHAEHGHPGAGVVFATEPGNGEKVGHLPKEHDSEKDHSLEG